MNRTLTITRKNNMQGALAKYYVQINGKTLGELANGKTVSLQIPTEPSTLKIVTPPALKSLSATIPGGYDDIAAVLTLRMGLFSSSLEIEMTSTAPKDQKTPTQVQAQRHASRVMELAGQYLQTGSEQASEELVDLYEVTDGFYKQQIDGYEGVKAIHAHILALRYVNEAYNPSKALAYAHIAELGYTECLRTLSPEEQKTTQLYLYQVWQILAYVDYVNDNLHGARQWIAKIPVQEIGASGIALIATVLFRLACEEGRNELFPRAFDLFQGMDKVFTEPARYPFEEDILRSAYSFYEMYYGDINIGQQVSVTYDPNRSVAILMRAWNLLKDPQQKAWLKEDIDKALEKAQMEA